MGDVLSLHPIIGNQKTQLLRTQASKITTTYEHWEVLWHPSVCFDRDIRVYSYIVSCHYLALLGLRQLDLSVSQIALHADLRRIVV